MSAWTTHLPHRYEGSEESNTRTGGGLPDMGLPRGDPSLECPQVIPGSLRWHLLIDSGAQIEVAAAPIG